MRTPDKKGIAVGLAALGAAVASELKKPVEERTWHGELAGFIPYDLRRPTVDSAKRKLWDPSGNFWSPSIFGVGWTPNLGRLAAQFGLLEQAGTVRAQPSALTETAEPDRPGPEPG